MYGHTMFHNILIKHFEKYTVFIINFFYLYAASAVIIWVFKDVKPRLKAIINYHIIMALLDFRLWLLTLNSLNNCLNQCLFYRINISMTLNQTMRSYKKRSEFIIIGLENRSDVMTYRTTNMPSEDFWNIYLDIAWGILAAVGSWFVRKQWNEEIKSQEARHVDISPSECLQWVNLDKLDINERTVWTHIWKKK